MASEAMDRAAQRLNDHMWPIEEPVEAALRAGISGEDIVDWVSKTVEMYEEMYPEPDDA